MFPDNEITLELVRANHSSAGGKPDVVSLTINRATCTATCNVPCIPGPDSLRVRVLEDGKSYTLCLARNLEGKEGYESPATTEHFPLCGTPNAKQA